MFELKRKTGRVAVPIAAIAAAALAFAAAAGYLQEHRDREAGLMRAQVASASAAANARSAANAARANQLRLDVALGRRMPVMGSQEDMVFGAHTQLRPLNASMRPAQQPDINKRVESAFDTGGALKNVLDRPSMRREQSRLMQAQARSMRERSALSSQKLGAAQALAADAPVCDVDAFGRVSGAALVSAVKAAETSCINKLFGLVGKPSAYPTFREAQMITIAQALSTTAPTYDGTNASSTLQLILFLRAGYYAESYDPTVRGTYTTALRDAVRLGMDAFVNNANFGAVSDAHGETLGEFLILIDSSLQHARYVGAIKRVLDAYNPATHNQFKQMVGATNDAYIALFRGDQSPDYVALMRTDSSLVDTLYNFAIRNWGQLNGGNGYLVANAGLEIGRLLQYAGPTKTLATARLKDLLDRSSLTGTTARVTTSIANMVLYFDKPNCGTYGLCDIVARVTSAALPVQHTCSTTLTIRAQALTAAQLAQTCQIVAGQEAYFHQQFQTGNVPVANDNNASLEMVVFDSSDDYGIYSGLIFGNATNNGGIYLEGDPSQPGNKARFIAYRAEWMDDFEIWNLTHEYVHYLDGRFNMYGDFGRYLEQKTVWWIEGMAEYISYSYRRLPYGAAEDAAVTGQYDLSEVFRNDYSSGTLRVYRWGYLASRYMFEKHRPQVSSILGYFRPGNYGGYATFMSGIGTSYDADFKAWLNCFADPYATGCGTPLPPSTPLANGVVSAPLSASSNQYYTIDVPAGASSLRISTFGGTGDVNLSVRYGLPPTGAIFDCNSRHAGNGEICDFDAPQPGKYYVLLQASPSYSGVSLLADFNPGTTLLSNNVVAGGIGAPEFVRRWFAVDVPTGATSLSISTFGGTGDLDLFVRYGATPTEEVYDCRPYVSGTQESCDFTAPQAGRYYVMLRPSPSYANVNLIAQYAMGGALLTNGVPVTGLSANGLISQWFAMDVPAGASNLNIAITGGTGDAMLYVRYGATPTQNAYDCRPYISGNEESCTFPTPRAGRYYVLLRPYSTGFGGVTLTGSYTAPSLPECTSTNLQELGRNCARSNISVYPNYYYYGWLYIPAGTPQLKITSSGGNGSVDLYYSPTSWATTTNYTHASRNADNSETITVVNPPQGYVYVSLYAPAGTSGVRVSTEY